MNKNEPIKALFLDRDGVINEDAGYVYEIKDFKFIDGIFDALREFAKAGYKLFVVTNQSGIGRGYYTQEQFDTLTKFMLEIFKKEQIFITKVYFCPHAPETNCACRKPNPKMILDAKDEFGIDIKNSLMIGDKPSDVEAGKRAGIGRNFLLDGINFKDVRDVLNKLKKEKSL
ncbi:D-glycero-beta-D-manno-heptose 1,7-bisphosphate 7-phosphatase [Campylobacter concisus]|jgi:D,D-heptose 1,7-bisphosphate phosphatase